MNKQKKSNVWTFFKRVNEGKFVECFLCKHQYKYSGNTTNLQDHLKRKHLQEWTRILAGNSTDMTDTATDTQLVENNDPPARKLRQNIKSYLQRDSYYDDNSLRKKKLDRLYIRMLALDFEPLRMSEHEGFKLFISALDNRYRLPDQTTVKGNMIPSYYNELRNKLKDMLVESKYISLTTDMWTSVSNEGILALTCHFIHKGNLISPLLAAKKIEGNHTGEVISSVIEKLLNEWQIRNKITGIVTDNASTMIKVAELLKIRHISCFAHTLNLVVSDGFKEPNFSILLKKCKNIVTFFRSSTLASDKLRMVQHQHDKTQLKLIQEVCTRWNSTYYMMERIYKIKSELAVAINECEKAPAPLSAEDCKALGEIINMLEPFELATKKISGEEYVTLSLVIPLIRGITSSLNSLTDTICTREGRELCDSLKKSVGTRLKPYANRTPTMLATILDPRFKKKGFKHIDDAERAAQVLQKEYSSLLALTQVSNTQNQKPSSPRSSTASTSKEDMLLFDFDTSDAHVPNPTSEAIIDIRQYLEKPVVNNKENPLKYWENSNSRLQEVAHKYLAIPATSVPSERIFSKAGQIMTERRNRLKDKHLNHLLFLKQNIPILEE